jgi:hypothetical protein
VAGDQEAPVPHRDGEHHRQLAARRHPQSPGTCHRSGEGSGASERLGGKTAAPA